MSRMAMLREKPQSAWFAALAKGYNAASTPMIHSVECNVCGWKGFRFNAIAGVDYIRFNAICPQCGSAERNRAMVAYMYANNIFRSKAFKVLEIAPFTTKRFYKPGCEYYSIDIVEGRAGYKMDVTEMRFKDEQFDVVICSHVLEHIKDDLAAMKEIYRVLKPRGNGMAYIMIPFRIGAGENVTYETPHDLSGHVRDYGRADFTARLENTGFKVKMLDINKGLDARRFRLGDSNPCFVCTK